MRAIFVCVTDGKLKSKIFVSDCNVVRCDGYVNAIHPWNSLDTEDRATFIPKLLTYERPMGSLPGPLGCLCVWTGSRPDTVGIE